MILNKEIINKGNIKQVFIASKNLFFFTFLKTPNKDFKEKIHPPKNIESHERHRKDTEHNLSETGTQHKENIAETRYTEIHASDNIFVADRRGISNITVVSLCCKKLMFGINPYQPVRHHRVVTDNIGDYITLFKLIKPNTLYNDHGTDWIIRLHTACFNAIEFHATYKQDCYSQSEQKYDKIQQV